MNVRAGRLVVLIGQVVLGACGAGSGLSLYDTGELVELDRSRSTTLRDQVKHHFGQCHPWQAVVVDRMLPQRELRELWRQQTAASYVLVEEGPAADAPFAHLRGLEYRLLLGLDSTNGVTPVLTEHDGLFTLYIKCPGLEGMELGCEIAHELADGESWPVCRTVAERASSSRKISMVGLGNLLCPGWYLDEMQIRPWPQPIKAGLHKRFPASTSESWSGEPTGIGASIGMWVPSMEDPRGLVMAGVRRDTRAGSGSQWQLRGGVRGDLRATRSGPWARRSVDHRRRLRRVRL